MPVTDVATDELDTEILQRGWAAIANRTPTMFAQIVWAARTDIGRVREHNEDKFDFFVPEEATQLALRGRLWAVADGMGGHSAGQIASEAALKSVIRSYFSPSAAESTEEALAAALTEANAIIYQAAQRLEEKSNMGTTVVAAVIKDDVLTVAHIGDSRAYLQREGEPIRQLTSDHSWVEEQVRRGAMTRAAAEQSPYRNYILRSVGVMPTVEADTTSIKLQAGDKVLLCSDGLCGYVSDNAISRLLESPRGLSQATLDLIDAANDAGGRDNSTALLLRVKSIGTYSDSESL